MEHHGEFDQSLRALAQERDKLLGEVPALSRERRAALTDLLLREFPAEAMFRKAANNRDRLLKHPTKIPGAVESALRRQLRARPARLFRQRVLYRGFGAFLFRPPVVVMASVFVVVTAAVLCLRQWASPGSPDEHNAASISQPAGGADESEESLNPSLMRRGELFARRTSIRAFQLNTDEPASLQASFLANTGRYFTDGNMPAFDLRPDLSVPAILVDDGFARTP